MRHGFVSMDILVKGKINKTQAIINQIKKNKKKLPKIIRLIPYNKQKKGKLTNETYLLIAIEKRILDRKKIENLITKLKSFRYVLDAAPVRDPEEHFHRYIEDKTCHFFFDIDSTITKGGIGVIQKETSPIFEAIKSKGYFIYLASGRPAPQVQQNMNKLDTEDIGIAENGGVIIYGKTGNNYSPISRNLKIEPTKALVFLKKKYGIREDPKHGSRITERIIPKIIQKNKLDNCIKRSGAKVDVIESGTAYHIATKGINKSVAIEKITSDQQFTDYDIVIAVGDSDLDVPMFKGSDFSFAVRNASKKAIENANVHLQHDFAEGVREMYEEYFTS